MEAPGGPLLWPLEKPRTTAGVAGFDGFSRVLITLYRETETLRS